MLDTIYTLEPIVTRNTLRISQQPQNSGDGILAVEINDPSSGQIEYEFNLVPQGGGEPSVLGEICGVSKPFKFDTHFAITNVSARQRYPWNGKVDISYEVVGGTLAELGSNQPGACIKVGATDRMSGMTYEARAISGDTGLSEGEHRLVWDMDADGLAFTSTAVVFTVSCETKPVTYCVIDLSAGPNAASYPVTYLAEPPSGGFNVDEYKTTKLVLRRIEPGTFMMCGEYRTTLTEPYYIGVFEVTQKQYELIMGNNPSYYTGEMRPVERVDYNMIRGSSKGAQWPASADVDTSSFMGNLRTRTGLGFDLPTEAQWEYACRAGVTNDYHNGGNSENDLKAVGRYKGNQTDGKGGYSQHTTVGSYLPNAWGLYDMHGGIWEQCLDWYGNLTDVVTDPKGSDTGSDRVSRGASWRSYAYECTSSFRLGGPSNYANSGDGFRLALPSAIPIHAIHFSANGGTGSMDNVILVGAETAVLPPVGFVGPDGAAFLGWARTPDGLVEYSDGAFVNDLSATSEEDVTLYAKWHHGSFNVRFNANGGVGAMTDQAIPLDLPQILSKCAFEREGYVFTGWARALGGAAVFYDEEKIWNLSNAGGTATLYAVWTEGARGLAIRYYDTYDYGYPAFGRSESDMIAYFESHTPKLSTNSWDWGATLDAGYMDASRFLDIEGLWREETVTNRYHGAYANKSKDYFAMALGGLVDIRESGTYHFAASADDQIALYIDGVFICGNDQWDQASYGEANLSAGFHRIMIGTYERDSKHGMFVAWKRPGDVSYTPIPQAALIHRLGSDTLEFFPGGGAGQMSPIAVDRNFGALLPPMHIYKDRILASLGF